MKKYTFLYLVLVSLFLSQNIYSQNDETGEFIDAFNAGSLTPSPDRSLHGVEFINNHYWVTGNDIGNDNHTKLYKFNAEGDSLVDMFEYPDQLYSWKDLASDGQFLYAAGVDSIWQINPANGTLTGLAIKGPGYYNAGIAYDPIEKHFWVSAETSQIYEIDFDGNIVNTVGFINDQPMAGLAWDIYSEGGPFLWIWSMKYTPDDVRPEAYQMNPENGQLTGLTFEAEIMHPEGEGYADYAGGAAITRTLYDGTAAFIGIQQSSFQESNDQLDWVVNYDLNIQDAGIPGPQISVNPEFIENNLMPGDSVDVPVEITNLSEEYQLNWNVSVEYPYSDTSAEIGTLLSSFDATDLTSNTDLRGIAFTEDHMFLSSSDNFNNDQFQLYKLSKDGSQIIETYDLFSLYSGWTTITSDDRYIYGAQQYQINQFDPVGDSVVNTFPKPSFSPRGLAYDPAMEHFYMGGLNGSIKVIDKSGEELDFFITDFPIEGLTWDKWSQGGPFLWAYYYDESEDAIVANRMDPASGGSTGVFFNTTDTNNENAMPKDIIVTPHQIDDKLVFGALNTTDDNGYVNFYDLATTPAPDWIEVIPPSFGETEPFGQSTFNIRLNSIMEDTLMTAQVRISSNDVSQPEVIVPVNFEMMPLNPTSTEALDKSGDLISKVYPNPSTGILNVLFSDAQETHQVKLLNMQGAVVKHLKVTRDSRAVMNVTNIPAGVYVLEVRNQKSVETRKIIVN